MYSYFAYGLNILSQITLPELESSNENPDVIVSRDRLDPWAEKVIMDGQNFVITDNGFYFLWKVGTCLIRNGNEIILDSSLDVQYISSFIVGPAMAMLLHQRGFLVLHASAVMIDEGVIAFLGDKGKGKSTIAASLQNKGYPLVTDDILAIKTGDNLLVAPGFPYIKLHSDVVKSVEGLEIVPGKQTSSNKLYHKATNGFEGSYLPLKTIYILNKGIDFDLISVDPQEAFTELIKHSFALHSFSNREKSHNFIQCTEVANKIPITSLKVQNSLDNLPKLVSMVENHVKDSLML